MLFMSVFWYSETNIYTNVKIIFLHKIFQIFYMFRSILIIFTELLNNNKEYIKYKLIIKYTKFFHTPFSDTKFFVAVQNRFVKCEGCSIIDFYNVLECNRTIIVKNFKYK